MTNLLPAPGLSPEYADLVGAPYIRGASGPISYDCYGLVRELATRVGMTMPDYEKPVVHTQIADLVAQCIPFWQPCEAGPGAVAAIRVKHLIEGRMVTLASHVAMVLPYGRMIHAWEPSAGVVVERIEPWIHRIVGFYRFPQ